MRVGGLALVDMECGIYNTFCPGRVLVVRGGVDADVDDIPPIGLPRRALGGRGGHLQLRRAGGRSWRSSETG